MKRDHSFDPLVDAYIAKSKPFAQPILTHIRELVHKACPGVVETIKWSRPFFEYKGMILANMSAFKEHCSSGVLGRGDCGGSARRKNLEARWRWDRWAD